MIWGIGKPGKTCKVCGLSVHTKCELKVRDYCQGRQLCLRILCRLRQTARKPKGNLPVPLRVQIPRDLNPQVRTDPLALHFKLSFVVSLVNAASASAFVRSITPQEVVDEHMEALVLFDFNATSEFELEVRGGSLTHTA